MSFTNNLDVALPEGATLSLTPAGVAIRFMAFAVDMVIRIVSFIVISLLAGQFGDFGVGLLLLMWFVLEWFYPVLFEITSGATPGKKIYKIKVVRENGLNITFASSLIRNLFRAVDFLPFGYVFGIFTMLLSGKFQRIGDLVAGTLVVYVPNEVTYKTSEDQRELYVAVPLTLEQQSAILNFNERMDTFSDERAEELANLLADFFPNEDYSAREKIQILAAQIIGKQ